MLIHLFGEKPSTLELKQLFHDCKSPDNDTIGLRFEEYLTLVGIIYDRRRGNKSKLEQDLNFDAAWNEIDTLGVGKINLEGFTIIMRQSGIDAKTLSDQELREIFYELLNAVGSTGMEDFDGKKYISYSAIKSLVMNKC